MPSSKSKKPARLSSKKRLLALHVDGIELTSLFCKPEKGCIVVETCEKRKFIEPLKVTTDELLTVETNGRPALSAEDIFGSGEKDVTASLETAPETEMTEEQSNESILLSILQSAPAKQFNYSVNIPSSLSHIVQLRNGYEKLKKSARRKKIYTDIKERLNTQITNDQFDYFLTKENCVFAFVCSTGIPLVNLYESIQTGMKKRFRLVSVLPDEVALSNLICFNYDPSDDDVLIIVHIGLQESKIIITKGGQITQIAPPIDDDANSPQILKTITGKILYEQSLGNIPDRYSVILTGKAIALDACPVFQQSLGITEVSYFTARPEIFRFPEEVQKTVSEFAVPLGSAVTMFFSDDEKIIPLSLIPEYIIRRQQVFKLAWHGYLLLLLIFLTPIWVNHQYANKSKTKANFAQRKVSLERSINELNWVEPKLDSLTIQTKLGKQKLELLESLSSGTHRWSYTLDKIIKAIHDAGDDLWLTEISTQGDGFQITGFSLYRNRAPRLAAQFPAASVENVIPIEIRGSMVYQFKIIVEKVAEDEKSFNPVVKIPTQSIKDESDKDIHGKIKKSSTLFETAIKSFNQKKFDEALATFEEIASRTGDTKYAVKSKCWIGKCYFSSGDYQEAIKILSTFIEENPQSDEKLSAMLFLGKAYTATNRNNDARTLFLSIVKQSPTSEIGLEASQLIATLR
ncbi:MAG: tetratricopeptide repeat protein [Candidatus Marinimicrobia bacterium]|nr:tetratricopeptide repeat protein [Candidatus Neomarinimicrobiota bacterium]